MNILLTAKYQMLQLETIAELQGLIEDLSNLVDSAANDAAIAHVQSVLAKI